MLSTAFTGILLFVTSFSAFAETVSCPQHKRTFVAVTSEKVTSIEELRARALVPDVYGKPDRWPIPPKKAKMRREVFLSCAYQSDKVKTFRVDVRGRVCQVIDYNSDPKISCPDR